MKARIASLPTRALIGIAACAVLVYAIGVWFLLVSPKRAEATTLLDDVAAAELRLVDAQVSASRPTQITGTRVGDVLRLARAMPSSSDQSSLVLELELLGRATGVKIISIAPGDPVVTAGAPSSIPVVVTIEGSYDPITRFLTRIRGLVSVRDGTVHARGRLFAVQALELSDSNTKGFPHLDAIVTLNAFVYDGPVAPAAPAPRVAAEEDTSTAAAAAREIQ